MGMQFQRMNVHYPPKLLQDLIHIAIAGLPNEVCGVLHEHNILHQYPNIFPGNREHGFDMDITPDPTIRAIWHSHPTGPEEPSVDDLQAMNELVSAGHDWPWIIVTTRSVAQYRGIKVE